MTREHKIQLLRAIEEKELRRAESDCWFWLTKMTATEDEQDKENPVKPFPDREYFPLIIEVIENEKTIFIEKSRTMMMTWLISGWLAHRAFTKPYTGIVVQSQDEKRALKPIHYSKVLWRHTRPRLQERWPLARPLERLPQNRIELANGSWIEGIVGSPDKIRSEHPDIVFLDEAALIESAQNYDVAVATRCNKIICNSSAYPGWFREMTVDAVPATWPEYGAVA